eukprot:753293-Hanusia_phi.AAC.1
MKERGEKGKRPCRRDGMGREGNKRRDKSRRACGRVKEEGWGEEGGAMSVERDASRRDTEDGREGIPMSVRREECEKKPSQKAALERLVSEWLINAFLW